MKKLFTLVLVLFTMSEIMYATSSNNYLLDSIVRVDESTGFVDSKKIYEYHANGTKSRYTAFNAWWSSWKVGRPKILNNKSTFVYDEDGNELDYFSSVLDTTTWIWKDTHYYLYDERHNRVCGVRKWNEDSTVVLQGSHYFYDEDNFQIGSDQFDTWNGVKVLDYKCENTKDAHGNKIIMVEYSKPESAWEGDYMSDPNAFNEAGWVRIDSVYYTYNEKQEKMQETIYRWDNENQEWTLDGYQIFEYDAEGHCIADTVFARDFETNVITYNNMTAYIYDSHGQLSRIQMFMPNFTENGVEWLENGMYAYDYTYDENGEILQLRDYIDWQNNSSSITYYTSTYYYSEHPVQDDPEPSCITASGTCGANGDNLTWELTCEGVLTISGNGEMANYHTALNRSPWDGDTRVKQVVFTDGVTNVGAYAFYCCFDLSSVTLPNSITCIGVVAFEYCGNLTEIEIPNSVTTIQSYALAGCGFSEIWIPSNVTTIGQAALDGNKLQSINVAEDNPNYCSVDGVLFDKNKTKLIKYPDGKQGECVIPSTVISIGYLGLASGISSITCEALVPPSLEKGAVVNVDKSIPLYVHYASINAYKAAEGWKEFTNILPIEGYPVIFLDYNSNVLSEQHVQYDMPAIEPEVPEREGYIFSGWSADIEHIVAPTYAIALYDKIGGTLTYLSEEGDVIATENVDLHLPEAPSIEGKSFKGWLTESADAENGIALRATYTIDNPTTHDDVDITPFINSATVIFPFITGALTYQLVIRDLFGHVVCKIMFSATGHLLGVAFAPSRNRTNQQATQTTGFNFTVEGLDANTTYEYEFVANDETDAVIETLSGSFTTKAESPTDNEQVNSPSAIRKYLEDGHLLIDTNSHIFDTQGKMVK